MLIKKNQAIEFEKQGVKMRVYNSKDQCPEAAVVYQETQTGHHEEFYHSKSNFIFYIIEGSGTWYIEDEPFAVESGDVLLIPPGKRFYYKGSLKQVCITAPAWEAEFEHHVRDVV
ncbi:MAG TPA: cupin domain-containing protein [Bacteroidales bacterium]|nr:cupin domain-containing protein [Bacteroidales bacterium]